jgi:hypothetical protein
MHSHGATAAQDANPGDDDATGGRLEKSIESAQEGRLAGAGGTEKNGEPPRSEAERGRRKRTRSGRIYDFEVFDLDHYPGN